MSHKNNPKASSKPPNKQTSKSVINIEENSSDDEQNNFPSAPASSLESTTKLDTKKSGTSKAKANASESKGKRGRPKGSINKKAEKETKTKKSTTSKKNVVKEPEIIPSESEEEEEEEAEAEVDDSQVAPTIEVEESYENTQISVEIIDLEGSSEIYNKQISKIVSELKPKAYHEVDPRMEEEEVKAVEPASQESTGNNNNLIPHENEIYEDQSIQASEEAETERKNNTQDTQEQGDENQDACQICYSSISQKFLQAEIRPLFKIIRCKVCDISVHRICVGKETLLSQNTKEFICDSCQSGVKSDSKTNKYKCHVCSNEDGYLHHASDKKWCHLLCAISSSSIFIKDVANMAIDISSFKKETTKIPNGNKCTICQVKVGTLRSTDKENGHFCHLHCALREAQMKAKNANWTVNFTLDQNREDEEENHTVIKNVDIRSQIVIQNIEEIQARLEGDLEKAIQEKLDSKASKKKGKTDEEIKPKISKIFERVKKEFASRFNIPLNQDLSEKSKSFELDHFSGKLTFIEKFRSRKDQNDMEIEDDDNQLNGKSRELANQLISFLADELVNEETLYEVNHSMAPTDKTKIVKGHLLAFQPIKSLTLPEVLFFVNIFQKRIEAATKNICEEGSLVEIFNLAEMIPFAVTGLLTPVYEKFYTAIAADHLMTSEIESCKPLKIYNPTTKSFDRANLDKNVARLNHAESLKKTYFNKPCQIITTKTREIVALLAHLSFLTEEFYNDLKDNFANREGASSNMSSLRSTPLKTGSLTPLKDQLPSIPDYKMVKLFERAKEIDLPQDSEEMQLIDWYIKKSKFAAAVIEKDQPQSVASPSPSPVKRMQEESPQKSPAPSRSEKETPNKEKDLLREWNKVYESPVSSRGKITQPKIVINLPKRNGFVKKPAYLKDDKDWNGKETEYEVQIKLIKEKPTLQDIEDQLANLGTVGTINQRQALERKKERALTWRQKYLDAVRKNDGSLKQVIADIDDIDIYLDEMKEAYDHKIEWAHIRIKVELLTRIFRDQVDPIDIELLEEVVQEGQKIPQCEPDDGDKFGTLQGKYENAKKMQKFLTTFEDEYGNPLKVHHLKSIENELRKLKVKIPEKKILHEKLEIDKNINALRNETLTTEALEQKINQLSVHFDVADESFVEELRKRLTNAKNLSRQAEAFIEGYLRYSLEDLSNMAKLVQKARDQRLIVAKVNVLENIINTYLLFDKVRGFFLNTQPITFEKLYRADFMNVEDQPQPEDLIKELEDKIMESELDRDQVEELRRLCYGVKLEDLASFEALHNFFQKLLTIIRKGEAKNILSQEYKRAQDVEDFLATLPDTLILPLPEEERQLFMDVQKEGAKITSWKTAVHEFIKAKPEERILNIYERAGDQDLDLGFINEELDNITQEIERLNKWYKTDLNAYGDLDDETGFLNKVYNWTHHIQQGLELRAQVEGDRYTTLDDIEGLIDAMKSAELPADDGLCHFFNNWCEEVRKVKRDFELNYARKKDVGRFEVENTRVEDLIKKNTNKPAKADADAMIDTIESVKKFATLDREVNSILSDMQQVKLWNAKIKEATETYKDLYTGDMEIEEDTVSKLAQKQDEITKKLNELKTEMMNLTLRDDKGESNLLLFEWICEAVFLLNGLKKNAKYEDWKRLMDLKEYFQKEEYSKVGRLVHRLEQEFMKGHKFVEFAEKLKQLAKTLDDEERTGKIEMNDNDERRESLENIEAIIAECEKCTVPMKDTKKDLQDIFDKYKLTKAKAEELLKPSSEKKSTLNDVTSLQKHIRKLPINMFEVYKALDDLVVEANRINTEATKIALTDSENIEELISRYQNCPISLPAMKRIMEFEDRFNTLKNYEEQLADLSNNDLTYDQLTEIENIIEELDAKTDDAYLETIRKYVFIKRCNILQKIKEEGTDSFSLSYQNIKSLRIDGGRLKDKFSNDTAVIEAFRFINEIYRRVEDKVTEIRQIEDSDKLSEISHIVSGLVDLNDIVIERKAQLSAKLNIQPPPSKYNHQYIEPSQEERRDPEQPVKRKRGRPRKGEEKNPRKETTAEKDRKSKEKSRNREKSEGTLIKKKREEASASSKRRLEPKQIKTLGHYYARVSGPPAKDQLILNVGPTSSQAVTKSIKQVFDIFGDYLKLEQSQSFKNAEEIVKIYPTVLESGKNLELLKRKLQNILRYKRISFRLFTEKNMLKLNLKRFFRKNDQEIHNIELKLRQRNVKSSSVNTRPEVNKENIRSTIDHRATLGHTRPVSGSDLRKEGSAPLLQDKKTKPELTKPAINEKRFKVHTDKQTKLKYDTQEIMGTGYDAFGSQPARPSSRSNTRIIQAEPIVRESATKIRKKGDPHSIRNSIRDVHEIEDHTPAADMFNAPPVDFDYNDIPAGLTRSRASSGERLDSKIRPTKPFSPPDAAVAEIPRNHIYRILEGSLENVDGTQKLKMALFTCDDPKKIARIPQFTDTDPLKIKFKKNKSKVEDYFNNILNEDSGIRIISGWVENRISIYQSRCEQIAQDFKETETIGTTTYNQKSCRILFLHRDQIPSTWRSKLRFRTKKITKTSNPILCFIIICRVDRLSKNPKFITPVIEKQVTQSSRRGSVDSLDSVDSLGDDESQASSIEDYEQDFGQLVEPRRGISSRRFDETSIEDGGDDEPRRTILNRNGKREFQGYPSDDEGFQSARKIRVDINIVNQLKEMDPEEILDFVGELEADLRHAYMDALKEMVLEEGEELDPSDTQDYLTDDEGFKAPPQVPVNPIDNRYPLEDLVQEQKFFDIRESKPINRPFLFNPENHINYFEESQSTLPIVMNQGLRATHPFTFAEDAFNTPNRQNTLQGHKKGNFAGQQGNNQFNQGKKSGHKNPRFNKNRNNKGNKGRNNQNQQHNQNQHHNQYQNPNQNQPQTQSNDLSELQNFVSLIQGAKFEDGQFKIPKSSFDALENFKNQAQQAEFIHTQTTTVIQSQDPNSSINPSQELDPLHAPLFSFNDPNEEKK